MTRLPQGLQQAEGFILCWQVEELWRSVARPFLARHPGVAPAGQERAAFLWAAGIVGAYSFTLGCERYQVGRRSDRSLVFRVQAPPVEAYTHTDVFTLACMRLPLPSRSQSMPHCMPCMLAYCSCYLRTRPLAQLPHLMRASAALFHEVRA